MHKQILFALLFVVASFFGSSQNNARPVVSAFYGPYYETLRYDYLESWGNQYGASVGLLFNKQNVNFSFRATEVFLKGNRVQLDKRIEFGLNYGLRFFDEKRINLYVLAGFTYGLGREENVYRGKPDYKYILPNVELKGVYQTKIVSFFVGIETGYFYRLHEKNSYNPALFYPTVGLLKIF